MKALALRFASAAAFVACGAAFACSSSSSSPTTGGTGGSATGGSATGGSATGGSATGGSATGGSGGSGMAPTITITDPKAGAMVTLGADASKSVNVAFTSTNFVLKAPGMCAGAAGCGHVHELIDMAACNDTGGGFPYNNAATASPAVAKFALCATPTGQHTISLELHNDDHSALSPPVSASVAVVTK